MNQIQNPQLIKMLHHSEARFNLVCPVICNICREWESLHHKFTIIKLYTNDQIGNFIQ